MQLLCVAPGSGEACSPQLEVLGELQEGCGRWQWGRDGRQKCLGREKPLKASEQGAGNSCARRVAQAARSGGREAGFEGPARVVGSEGEESLDLAVGGGPEKRRWRATVPGGLFYTE